MIIDADDFNQAKQLVRQIMQDLDSEGIAMILVSSSVQ
jgi:hypothetical protein